MIAYSDSLDKYGTVDDYLEINLQFCLLVLFGIVFPLGFLVALIWNILELQTDKAKMLKYIQRPVPVSENTIGTWLSILELSTYIAICSNSAIVTFTASR